MALSLEEIKAAIAERRRTSVEVVHVPELGGDICVRLLGSEDLQAIGFFDGPPPGRLLVQVLAACICDESGVPLFPKKADLEIIGKIDFALAERIFAVAAKLNGLRESDVKEAAEGFGETQSEGGSTS
jgi:hypothetical protein